jgi:hypothetical protein
VSLIDFKASARSAKIVVSKLAINPASCAMGQSVVQHINDKVFYEGSTLAAKR